MTFAHIERTGLTKTEILRRARALRDAAPFHMTLQQAVDTIIDAVIESNQG